MPAARAASQLSPLVGRPASTPAPLPTGPIMPRLLANRRPTRTSKRPRFALKTRARGSTWAKPDCPSPTKMRLRTPFGKRPLWLRTTRGRTCPWVGWRPNACSRVRRSGCTIRPQSLTPTTSTRCCLANELHRHLIAFKPGHPPWPPRDSNPRKPLAATPGACGCVRFSPQAYAVDSRRARLPNR